MKSHKYLLKFDLLLIVSAVIFFSCASAPMGITDTMVIGSGSELGTASATASVGEHRRTGETTGNSMKYGFIVTADNNKSSHVKKLAANSLTNATETAYANALYEIIQQAKMAGGNALKEVVSRIDRRFDLNTNIETVTVTIRATIIRTDKK